MSNEPAISFNIQDELRKLPNSPGVYLMHGPADEIIYVGKAINLKNRVRSYFRESTVKTQKIAKMVSLVSRFEYIVTGTEIEALILENNLIKEHSPKYNTMLKDDKTYPFVRIDLNEKFPVLSVVRRVKKDNAKYLGPFINGSLKEVTAMMNKLYKLRTCNRSFPRDFGKHRPCLNFHISQCLGPCCHEVDEQVYLKNIDSIIKFFQGNQKSVLDDLTAKMERLSENLEFEEAALIRDQIEKVKAIAQKQTVTDARIDDIDIIAMAKGLSDAVVQIFFLRGGKLIGREHFYMTEAAYEEEAAIIENFVKQFYSGTPFIPSKLYLQCEIPDTALLTNWLSQKRGHSVSISVPKRGSAANLLKLALQNAEIVINKDSERLAREQEKTLGALGEIAAALSIELPRRIEAYDISNTSGYYSVGSMVVFEDGKAKRSDYRKFRIKTVAGPDDYASLREILSRRFLHNSEKPDSFSKKPDLLLIDGGEGQISSVQKVLDELDEPTLAAGMFKDDRHRSLGLFFKGEKIFLDQYNSGFKLLTRIQDEAHRFAISYHRSIRMGQQVKSVLDDIPSIGEKRRKALMLHFTSIEDVKNADTVALQNVKGMDKRSAQAVYTFFHNGIFKEEYTEGKE